MVIGITGGVGCGKSTVLNLLEEKYGQRLLRRMPSVMKH